LAVDGILDQASLYGSTKKEYEEIKLIQDCIDGPSRIETNTPLIKEFLSLF